MSGRIFMWVGVWGGSVMMFCALTLVERHPIPAVIMFAVAAALVCLNVALTDRPAR